MTICNIIWSGINSLIIIFLPIIAKFWANKKLEKLKSSLSKVEFIHRLQFEKEFKIYEKLWSYLVDLQEATEQLDPVIEFRDPNKSEEEIKTEKMTNVRNAYVKVQKGITRNKPFYDKNVYEGANDILKKSIKHWISFAFPSKDPKNIIQYYEEAKKLTTEINAIIDKIENAIRERIRNIGEAKLIG